MQTSYSCAHFVVEIDRNLGRVLIRYNDDRDSGCTFLGHPVCFFCDVLHSNPPTSFADRRCLLHTLILCLCVTCSALLANLHPPFARFYT